MLDNTRVLSICTTCRDRRAGQGDPGFGTRVALPLLRNAGNGLKLCVQISWEVSAPLTSTSHLFTPLGAVPAA